MQIDTLEIIKTNKQVFGQADLYKDMLEHQTVYFENLLTTIGIILTILIVIFTLFNVFISREILKNDAKRLFKREKKKLHAEFQNELTKMSRINEYNIQNNSAKFYTTSIIPGKQFLALNHYFFALEVAIELKDNERIIEVLNLINSTIDLNSKEEFSEKKLNTNELKERVKNKNFDFLKFENILSSVPDNLRSLKNQIIDKISEEKKN